MQTVSDWNTLYETCLNVGMDSESDICHVIGDVVPYCEDLHEILADPKKDIFLAACAQYHAPVFTLENWRTYFRSSWSLFWLNHRGTSGPHRPPLSYLQGTYDAALVNSPWVDGFGPCPVDWAKEHERARDLPEGQNFAYADFVMMFIKEGSKWRTKAFH